MAVLGYGGPEPDQILTGGVPLRTSDQSPLCRVVTSLVSGASPSVEKRKHVICTQVHSKHRSSLLKPYMPNFSFLFQNVLSLVV